MQLHKETVQCHHVIGILADMEEKRVEWRIFALLVRVHTPISINSLLLSKLVGSIS